MISRRVLWSIVLGIAGVMIMIWRMGSFPAHLVIINQSGKVLANVVLDDGGRRIELGSIGNGESRRLSIDPAESVSLTFRTAATHTWHSSEAVTAGQSVVLYITPDDHVIARNRIGTLAR